MVQVLVFIYFNLKLFRRDKFKFISLVKCRWNPLKSILTPAYEKKREKKKHLTLSNHPKKFHVRARLLC